MPNRAPHQCTYPGCHTLVSNGSRCALHARQAEQERGSSTQRGYDYEWRKIRNAFLQKHPWCSDPFGEHQGKKVIAVDVDHIIPKAQGGSNDDSNLQSLCHRCHSRKTPLTDGGFGHEKSNIRGFKKMFCLLQSKPCVCHPREIFPDQN